jgi:hypothetical protein
MEFTLRSSNTETNNFIFFQQELGNYYNYTINYNKPRIGIRASAPNQIWHLDLSVIKLLGKANPNIS